MNEEPGWLEALALVAGGLLGYGILYGVDPRIALGVFILDCCNGRARKYLYVSINHWAQETREP